MINSVCHTNKIINNYKSYDYFQNNNCSLRYDILTHDSFVSFRKLNQLEFTNKTNAFKPVFSNYNVGYEFELKKQKNLPCACCGKIMISIEEREQFAKAMTKASGKHLIAGLKKYQDRLPETEKKVIDIVLKSVERHKYDHKKYTISDLIKKEYNESLRTLESEQKQVLKEIADLAMELDGETKEKLVNDLKSANKILIAGKNGDTFKRKIFIDRLKSYRALEFNFNNREKLGKIVSVAKRIPSSSTNTDAFLVKYSRRTDKDIAYRLLKPISATTEHIRPYSAGGKSDPANYLVECERCNAFRDYVFFSKWVKQHPEMIENSQKYIDVIMYRIIDGTITGFDDYPEAVKKTLEKESNGAIILNIDKMEEYKINSQIVNNENLNSTESNLDVIV